jgi:methionyl-tRNA formyltransferase
MGLSLVFMGTPLFAKYMLQGLYQSEHRVLAVVTVADKPAGRGQKIQESEVKRLALENGTPILQPQSLRDPQFLSDLSAFQADLFVVVAFRMLPEIVWKMPPKGTINLHASLLPHYRGAAPIHWAIINGEQKTGLSTFFIDENIDCGSLLLQAEIKIEEHWTTGRLHDAMLEPGSMLIVQTLNSIEGNGVVSKPQQASEALKEAPKLTKENTKIDFTRPGEEIARLVRGLNPFPTAYCYLLDIKHQKQVHCKIFEGKCISGDSVLSEPLKGSQEGILFPCKNGYFSAQKLQLEGKKALDFKAFLAGNDAGNYRLA